MTVAVCLVLRPVDASFEPLFFDGFSGGKGGRFGRGTSQKCWSTQVVDSTQLESARSEHSTAMVMLSRVSEMDSKQIKKASLFYLAAGR